MTTSELKGKAVVSISNSAKLGVIEDLLLDRNALAISGILIKSDHGQGVIPFSDVRSNGPDAVMVDSNSVVQWRSELDGNSTAIKHLFEEKVVDTAGKVVGRVHEVEVDDSGHVTMLHITEGGVFGLGAHATDVPREHIRGIGADLVTVDAV